MPVWAACRVECTDADETFVDDDCDLRIEGSTITVHYWDELGAVVFVGQERAEGGYHLVCRSRPRVATLRWDTHSRRLEGEWSEGDAEGRWSIALPHE